MPLPARPLRARHLALALPLALLAACAPAPDGPPNLLLILADDLGSGDLGGAGVPTPNLDRLAAEGVRFTRHYTEATCAPTRAALLTGRHPGRLGFRPRGRGISPQVETLPEVLAAAGYRTHHVGKWHLGELPAARPRAQGFETALGFLDPMLLAAGQVLRTPRYDDPWLFENDAPARPYDGHLEQILADAAVALVAADDPRPWFLNLWLFAPHEPLEPADAWAEGQPPTPAGRYRALVAQLDANVGRLLEALDATGQARRTLVVFASDNGAEAEVAPSNRPYPGGKDSYEEGGVRTPLLMRWPGVLPAGAVVEAPVSVLDLLPTLATAAGATLPDGLDGRDLLPLARGGQAGPRPLFWEEYGQGPALPRLGRARYSYSALAPDGRRRLLRDRRDGRRRVIDYDADPHGGAEVDAPESAAELDALYRAFHADAHRVRTRVERDDAGLRWLVGDDLQRVPGFGGWSLGLGVTPADTSGRRVLATQPGLYEIALGPEGLRARLVDAVLAGPALAPGVCHTVVLTAFFHRSSRAPTRDFAVAELWVDGARVASAQPGHPVEDEIDFGPTALGHDGRGGAAFEGGLSTPVVWNEHVERGGPDFTPDVRDLEAGLCPGRGGS